MSIGRISVNVSTTWEKTEKGRREDESILERNTIH
jgi:hypothetical protein